MKTPTIEENIFEILLDIENNCVGAENSIDNVMYYVKEHTKQHIEALREELESKSKTVSVKVFGLKKVILKETLINTINNYLENIK